MRRIPRWLWIVLAVVLVATLIGLALGEGASGATAVGLGAMFALAVLFIPLWILLAIIWKRRTIRTPFVVGGFVLSALLIGGGMLVVRESWTGLMVFGAQLVLWLLTVTWWTQRRRAGGAAATR